MGIRGEERARALEKALAQIERDFGKGTIIGLGSDESTGSLGLVPSISTSSLSLDAALGTGGVARGRIVEVFGPEGSGKTTLCLHILAEAQKAGALVGYLDAEHSLDIGYARRLGIRSEDLLIGQPSSGEQALSIVDKLVRTGALAVVVVDSVAALVPEAELRGEIGSAGMGLQARLMSQAMRKLAGAASKTRTCLIFVNQVRVAPDGMSGAAETTPGGRALKFYASQRLEIRRVGVLRGQRGVTGSRTRVKVVKNKLAAPYKEVEFDIRLGSGISRAAEVLDLGAEARIIDRSGGWFTFNGERISQGREEGILFLEAHPELLTEIERRLVKKHGWTP